MKLNRILIIILFALVAYAIFARGDGGDGQRAVTQVSVERIPVAADTILLPTTPDTATTIGALARQVQWLTKWTRNMTGTQDTLWDPRARQWAVDVAQELDRLCRVLNRQLDPDPCPPGQEKYPPPPPPPFP